MESYNSVVARYYYCAFVCAATSLHTLFKQTRNKMWYIAIVTNVTIAKKVINACIAADSGKE